MTGYLPTYQKSFVVDSSTSDRDFSQMPFLWIDSPFFESILKTKQLTPGEEALVRKYREDGYLILNDRTIEESLTRQVSNDVAEGMDKETGRLQDAWRSSEGVRQVAVHESILSLLRLLYDREPVPFQTLNFIKGTEQATHSDAIHFNSLPRGYMAAVWVALEDITIKQGPLHYFPKSHKLPEYDYYDLGIADELLWPDDPIDHDPNYRSPRTKHKYGLYEQIVARLAEEHGFERQLLTLKRGDFLVWSANLLHGGNPILETGSTRKSQVIHYHFDGVVPWTPHFSNPRVGQYHVPQLVNIRTMKAMVRSYNFMNVQFIPQGITNRYRIKFAPTGSEVPSEVAELPFYEELAKTKAEIECYQKEVLKLQKQLHEITHTRLWKTVQPIREFKQRFFSPHSS